MTRTFRPVIPVIAGISLLLATSLSLQADDYLNRAAAQYRDKDYAAAAQSASKSADLTQRAFIQGMSAHRLEKYDEAALYLAEAEQKLPLIADYAAYFHAEALLKLKKYPAAAAKAASIATSFPASKLLRRSEKLLADIQFESGDFKSALKSYQTYIEKHPSGSDSVDAAYQAARCREELADHVTALQLYRTIWLNNPASSQAVKAQDRISQLEATGQKLPPCTAEELLKRASALYAQNEFTACLKTLDMIPAANRPPALSQRIDLRAGMAQYRLRQYKLAEKQFSKVSTSTPSGIRSEANFWLAKSLDRQDFKERALTLYLELAGDGKKQEFADDALLEAAGLKRGLGQYAEAARLFDQAAKLTSDPKAIAKSAWDAGWCRYLAGDYPAAAEAFRSVLTDDTYREKALYWLGRAAEKKGDAASAASWRNSLLDEFPSGFYATWYREQKGMKDTRDSFGVRDPLADLPSAPGFEKPRLLATLGMLDEARTEMTALRKKNGEKKGQFPALARIYLEMRDYGSAISLFLQNRPVPWEKNSLPLWAVGYPRAYSDLVGQYAAQNNLSEGLVYALIRAESGFEPAVKSPAGAIGLMQLMPATAKLTAREKGEFNPLRLTVPEYNIRLGTKHLHDLMKEYDGDVVYMAAAYNAGSGALERWRKSLKGLAKDEFIESIPYQETRDYVKKVYASAAIYRQLYAIK